MGGQNKNDRLEVKVLVNYDKFLRLKEELKRKHARHTLHGMKTADTTPIGEPTPEPPTPLPDEKSEAIDASTTSVDASAEDHQFHNTTPSQPPPPRKVPEISPPDEIIRPSAIPNNESPPSSPDNNWPGLTQLLEETLPKVPKIHRAKAKTLLRKIDELRDGSLDIPHQELSNLVGVAMSKRSGKSTQPNEATFFQFIYKNDLNKCVVNKKKLAHYTPYTFKKEKDWWWNWED